MWHSILSMAVLSAFVVLPQATWGGIITIPVPDLLGTYDCLGLSSIDSRQSVVEFPPDWGNMNDPANIRLVVRGILTPGLVRGDGIRRAAQEAVLMGSWAFCFENPGGDFGGAIGEHVSGPFTFQIDYTGLGLYYMPSPDNPPEVIRLFMAPVISLYLVPWLVEQPDPIEVFERWGEGLESVTPLTATITEAYWEFEGPSIPEPATLSLLALGALVILRRSSGRAKKR